MADVTELLNTTDPLTVKFPTGAVIALEYQRSKVTSNLIDPTSKNANVLAKAISDVVTTWDVTRDGGAIDPKDVDAVATLPIAVLQLVLKRIIGDQDVDPN